MTVEEKRQLELKTMRQIIGIYCHDNIIRRRANYAKIVNRYGSMHSIASMYAHIWSIRRSVAYAKHIVMRRLTEKKIREIMRYGGPRMLLHSPIQVIRHMYLEWKDKKVLILRHNKMHP